MTNAPRKMPCDAAWMLDLDQMCIPVLMMTGQSKEATRISGVKGSA